MLEHLFSRKIIIASNKVNIDAIRKMDIPGLRFFGNNNACGPTFQDRPICELLKLRASGIKKIVDFRADASDNYAKLCKKYGFKYFKFPLDSINDINNKLYYNKKTVSPKLIDFLKKFFKIINNGEAYIGCQYGVDRTNKALTINYFLNNKKQKPPMLLKWPDETMKAVINRNVRSVSRIFHHMTDKQKHQLKLPNKFNDILKEKVGALIEVNKNI